MKFQRIFLPHWLASFSKSFFHFQSPPFITSFHLYKLEVDSLLNKEKLEKVGSFWCNLLKAISTDLLQKKEKKKDCKKHYGKWWTRGQQTSVSSSLIPTIAILSRWSVTHIHHREPLLNFSSLIIFFSFFDLLKLDFRVK